MRAYGASPGPKAQCLSYIASMNLLKQANALIYEHIGYTPTYIPDLLQLVYAKLSFSCSSLFCCCDLSLRCRRHQQLKLAAAAAWLECVTSLGLRSQVGSCYCLFIHLLLCIGLAVGKQTWTLCHANQRQITSVVGRH